MESDKENTESICNEVSNIYTGIEDFDLGREIEKLTEENRLLEDHIGSLQGDIEKLSSALLKLKAIQENLTKNISSLYLTAKNEIDRKDRIIADLRCQLDNITFRRMGIRQQKRKPEEALEPNNKKPKYQENDTCSESNHKKSSRQQTHNQDVILIDDDSSSSSSKNLVERYVLTSDQQNRKDNGTKEHTKKPEESNCSNEKNFEECRNRSKSIDRRQQNVDDSKYKNRRKSRDRRKQNDDSSPHYRRQEEHDDSDSCRYQRPDYGYNDDERFDKRTRYRQNRKTVVNRPPYSRRETKSEKENVVTWNEDTSQCAKSESAPNVSSDTKDNSCKKTVKPVRKKLRVVDKLEKEIKKKQEEKLSFTLNNSMENISRSSIDNQEVNSTKNTGNIFTDGIHGIMDDVLQNIRKEIHVEDKLPDQFNQYEDLRSIEDSYSVIKLQWRLSSEKATSEEHAEAFQDEEGTKKKSSEEQEKTVENSVDKLFDEFSETNNFDYSSGESGTVSENIMKKSDMESLLRQTLSTTCTESGDGSKIRNESNRTPSKDIIIVSNIMIPKELTKIEISVDGVNKTHLDGSLNVDCKTKDNTEVSEVQHSIMNKDSIDIEKQIESSSGEADAEKRKSDDEPVTNPSSDSIAIQENKSEIFNPLPQMNPSYKIPKKNPNILTKDQCITLSDPPGEPSGYEMSRSGEQRGSNCDYFIFDSRSHRSRSEGRHKNLDRNRDDRSPRYNSPNRRHRSREEKYHHDEKLSSRSREENYHYDEKLSSRSREENYHYDEKLSSRSRSRSRFQPTKSRSRSIEAEDRARDYSKYHYWKNEHAVGTHLSRSTSRDESRHYSSRSKSFSRSGTRRYRSRSKSEADDISEDFNQITKRSKSKTEADELGRDFYRANRRYRSKSITEEGDLGRDSHQANRRYRSKSITEEDELGRVSHQANMRYRSKSITEKDELGRDSHQANGRYRYGSMAETAKMGRDFQQAKRRYRSRSITESDETGRDYHQANRRSRSKTRADKMGRDSQARYRSRSTRKTDFGRYSEADRYRSESINQVGRLVPEKESKGATRCRSVTPMPSEDPTENDGRWETDDRQNVNTRHMSPDGPESPDDCMESTPKNNLTRRVIGLKQYSERLLGRKEPLHEGKMDSISGSNISTPNYEMLKREVITCISEEQQISHRQLKTVIDGGNLSYQDIKVGNKTEKGNQLQNVSHLKTQENELSEKFLTEEFANSAKKTTVSNPWKLQEIDFGDYDLTSGNKRRGKKQREPDTSKYEIIGNMLDGKQENFLKKDYAQSPQINATIDNFAEGDQGRFSVQCPIQQPTSQKPMDTTKNDKAPKLSTTGNIDYLKLLPSEDSTRTTKQYDKACQQSIEEITTDEVVPCEREIIQSNSVGSRQKREVTGNKVSDDNFYDERRCLPLFETQETFIVDRQRTSLEKNTPESVRKIDSEESQNKIQLSPTYLIQPELLAQRGSVTSRPETLDKKEKENVIVLRERERAIISKKLTTSESTKNLDERVEDEKSRKVNAGKASEMQIENFDTEGPTAKIPPLPTRSMNLEKQKGLEIEVISIIPKTSTEKEKNDGTKTIPVKGKRRTLMDSIRDLARRKSSEYSNIIGKKEKEICSKNLTTNESRTDSKEDEKNEKANSGNASEMQIENHDTKVLTAESVLLPTQSMHLKKMKELEIEAISIVPTSSTEIEKKEQKSMDTEESNIICEKEKEGTSKNFTTNESRTILKDERSGNASEMQNFDTEELTAKSLPPPTQSMHLDKLKQLEIEAISIVPKTSIEKEKSNETKNMSVNGKRRKSMNSIGEPSKKNSPEDSNIIDVKANTGPNFESQIEYDEGKEPKLNVQTKGRSQLLHKSQKSTSSSKKLPNSESNATSNRITLDEKKNKIEAEEKGQNEFKKVIGKNISNEDKNDLVNQIKEVTTTMPELLKTETVSLGKVPQLKTNKEKLPKQNSSSKENVPKATSTTVESIKNLTEEAFSETITIQSTPNKNRPEYRKRITPIPVKDTPICSFENILVKNQSPFHTEPTIQMSPLTLTHEGEIPVLHLEDNHFHNLRGDSQSQKVIDTNILSLLDQMNISNMDCDIMKFGSTNEKAESSEPPSGEAVTFENTINPPPSVPETCDPQKPSGDNSQKTLEEVKNEMQQDKPPSGQNTSNIRRRRRCRLVVID